VPTDEQKLNLARDLLSQPSFEIVKIILKELEEEAVRGIQSNSGDSVDHLKTLQFVGRFKTIFDNLAQQTGRGPLDYGTKP